MSKRLVKSATENFPETWRYQATDRIPGAFRAISVENLLLERTPTISLYEWGDVNWSSPPAYAAISHTWTQSAAVLELCKSQKRPLVVDTGELNKPYNREIYWTGLVQAAHAARRLGCEYLWLDLLCIDQVTKQDAQGDNDLEKNKQIQNMGKIYKCTRAVLVMVGGVGCVQGVDELSSWIDRAWTLQEVTLSKEVWAVVNWPYQDDFRLQPLCLDDPDDDVNHEKYHFQFIQVKDTIKIIRLVKLLTLEPALIPMDIPGFKIRCFDSCVHISENNLSGRTAASSALYSMMKSETKEMTNCGAWRCMFQRTATKEEDMIYSMMELIGVQLEVDYSRNLKDLYSEVAKNVAAKGFPAWLSIGGASGDIIPRDPSSGLIPELPTYRGNELPTYKLGNASVPVTKLLEDSLNYVSHFDVRFPTSSVPHLVCCRTFEFAPPKRLTPDRRTGDLVRLNRCELSVAGAQGLCSYHGKMGQRIVIIGRTDSLDDSGLVADRPSRNNWYVYLVSHSDRDGWVRVGSGKYEIRDGVLPEERMHMNFGQQSQTKLKVWNCDCDTARDIRTLPLTRSYGIISRPLEENGPIVDEATGLRYGEYRMSWYANKGDRMKTNEATWQKFHMNASDEEWNQSGPVTRTVDLYSHTSSIETKCISWHDLAKQVTQCTPTLKFDLKSGDVERHRRSGPMGGYWQCHYWIGIEYKPNVIYMRVAKDDDGKSQATTTAVIPSWEVQM